MKRNIFRNTIVVFILIAIASSCKKDVPPGGTAVQVMAGDWHVKVNDNSGYYITMYTFNTSDDSSTQMWLQANGLTSNNIHIPNPGGSASMPGLPIGVKGKVNVDVANQTFSGSNITNINSNATNVPTFSIANGKVTSNGTVGPGSDSPADLITFDLIVNGVTYKVSGYHRTGYLEDLPPSERP
ncbi:lipid-binding protein [Pedobacter sp. ASV1-7]|uniref:lipid-binding protein n=1 Tax=Pedobacter sp. ASV1-7 TaxID=3145237 RepID=UPI0032E86932